MKQIKHKGNEPKHGSGGAWKEYTQQGGGKNKVQKHRMSIGMFAVHRGGEDRQSGREQWGELGINTGRHR
ncbi:hypothetical protein EXN66_Car013759 [Channa argus]|uniref:Uncharacterized protein n=1 Tax=Channa argus TaxID=215402 RepID=A0A6G1Q738_CHAAH|nr:hypothetical protein EXN66_Car013759 [Channa argus]